MDLKTTIINMLVAPITYIFLLLIIPPYLVLKFISFIKRSIYAENVAGKVVLITGASSGIGEYMAYEYARRGARLVLAARREERLREVANKARSLGSPDVMVVPTDVSKLQDCMRMVDEAIKCFGQLDHLVNNAGIVNGSMFEDSDVPELVPIMNINYWGSVYSTRAAVPHLRKSKGKIIVIGSCGVWFSMAKMSFYNASKAAVINFFETLRTEFGSDIGITIVNPGIIESEMTQGDNLKLVNMHLFPVASTEECVKVIVNSACRGDKHLTVPSWVRMGFFYQVFCPEFIEWMNYLINTKFNATKMDGSPYTKLDYHPPPNKIR